VNLGTTDHAEVEAAARIPVATTANS